MSSAIGVITFPGSNGDQDSFDAFAFNLGVPVRMIDYRQSDLDGLAAIVLPGGFSYGDHLRCGDTTAQEQRIVVNLEAFDLVCSVGAGGKGRDAGGRSHVPCDAWPAFLREALREAACRSCYQVCRQPGRNLANVDAQGRI